MKGKKYLVLSLAAGIVLILGLYPLTFRSMDVDGYKFPLTSHYQMGVYISLVSTPFLIFFIFGFLSFNLNLTKPLELLDPAKFEFKSEWFILTFGKSGKILRYWMKCILLGLILYVSGGIGAVLSDTLIPDPTRHLNKGFNLDFYFLTLSLVTGFTSLFAIRALRGLGDKLAYTDHNLNDSLNIESNWLKFVARITGLEETMKSNKWLGRSKLLYYYHLSSLGLAAIGLVVGWLTVNNNPDSWIGLHYPISSVVFIACCTFIGFTVGALIFISARGITILCRYCQEYVLPESISAPDRVNIGYTPDKFSGLRKIGQFSFELDLAAAIPSFAFFASYLSGTKLYGLVSLICLSFYTIVLIGIFFLPLRPFHVKMANAKEGALADVNRKFSVAYSEIQTENQTDPNKTNPRQLRKLKDIYFLHERIISKSVWPLDRWIDLKIFATVPLPVLLSIISNYLSKLLP